MSKSETGRLTREDSAAAIKRWRDGGGYEGALARQEYARPVLRPEGCLLLPIAYPIPAVGHMPW